MIPCNLFSIFFHFINIGFAYELLFLSVLLLARKRACLLRLDGENTQHQAESEALHVRGEHALSSRASPWGGGVLSEYAV